MTAPSVTLSPALQDAIEANENARQVNLERAATGPDAAALEAWLRERAVVQGIHPATLTDRLFGDGPLHQVFAAERSMEIQRELFSVWQGVRERWATEDSFALAHVLGNLVRDLLDAAEAEHRDEIREILSEYLGAR